ncbi:hypothetical protein PSYAC_07952, partial [Pseudomonas syringae pv. actinidiae str. M302091]
MIIDQVREKHLLTQTDDMNLTYFIDYPCQFMVR